MDKPINLTKKTAQILIDRVFPGLKIKIKEGGEKYFGAVAFTAFTTSGNGLKVSCENDWFVHNHRIRLIISDPSGGGAIVQYFYPDTLERDFEAEEAEKQKAEKDVIKEWVWSIGPEKAHKLVDQYWEWR